MQQDEVFFLQEEVKKLQTHLAEKERIIQKLVLDQEKMKAQVSTIEGGLDSCQQRAEGLQKTLWQQEKAWPEKMKMLTDPFQATIEAQEREGKICQMALEEKNRRINEISGEGISLRAEIDNAARNHALLLEEFRKVSSERDSLKADLEKRLQEEKAPFQEKIRVLESRLLQEKRSRKERIKRSLKPWEEKVVSLGQQLKEQDNAWRTRIVEERERLQTRIRELEGMRDPSPVMGMEGSDQSGR